MNDELLSNALTFLDSWLHDSARLNGSLTMSDLELLGSVSIVTRFIEDQRIAEEEKQKRDFDTLLAAFVLDQSV